MDKRELLFRNMRFLFCQRKPRRQLGWSHKVLMGIDGSLGVSQESSSASGLLKSPPFCTIFQPFPFFDPTAFVGHPGPFMAKIAPFPAVLVDRGF
jgi:hypothetical protein